MAVHTFGSIQFKLVCLKQILNRNLCSEFNSLVAWADNVHLSTSIRRIYPFC